MRQETFQLTVASITAPETRMRLTCRQLSELQAARLYAMLEEAAGKPCGEELLLMERAIAISLLRIESESGELPVSAIGDLFTMHEIQEIAAGIFSRQTVWREFRQAPGIGAAPQTCTTGNN